MIKRALNFLWNTEKGQPLSKEYEKWTKTQLIEKIYELEKVTLTGKDSLFEKRENGAKEGKIAAIEGRKTSVKQFDFEKHHRRFIALRFAYLGWNYNGLNFQYEPTPLPTVEEEILKALAKARLISSVDPLCCNFSRCGRTDKGVSAMNQVISLSVRSNLSEEEQSELETDGRELPYIAILNSMLPADIRITAVCLRPPPNFDARFSCLYRHYRYLFRKQDLDLDLMKQAAQKFVGVHDFRNFCRIDGSKQITNYRREVYSADIISYKDDFYMFDLKGTAFLWHQVRCMVAILFHVGQKLEQVKVIDDLLNVDQLPCKPSYEMANDIPLVLYDCKYPEMDWLSSTSFPNSSAKVLKENAYMRELALDYKVKAHLVSMMEDIFMQDTTKLRTLKGAGTVDVGDGRGRNFKKYVPLVQREVGESFEVVNEKYRQKKKRKLGPNDH